MRLSDALSLHLSPIDTIRCPSMDPNFDRPCNNFTSPPNVLLEQLARTNLGDPSAPSLFRNLASVVLCEKHNTQEERNRLLAVWMKRQSEEMLASSLRNTGASRKISSVAATERQTAVGKGTQNLEDPGYKDNKKERFEDSLRDRRQDIRKVARTSERPSERRLADKPKRHVSKPGTRKQGTWGSGVEWDKIMLYLLLAFTVITLCLKV